MIVLVCQSSISFCVNKILKSIEIYPNLSDTYCSFADNKTAAYVWHCASAYVLSENQLEIFEAMQSFMYSFDFK